jgi:hypothetical protein
LASQPPPSRHGRGGAKKDPNKPKTYVGIGRMGLNAPDEMAPAYREKPLNENKSRFNVDEGRDYTLDAPATHILEKKNTNRSIKSHDSGKKGAEDENFEIPAIKSPA